MSLDETKVFEVFWEDLTPAAQKRFLAEMGSTPEQEGEQCAPLAIVLRDLSEEGEEEDPEDMNRTITEFGPALTEKEESGQ